MKERIINKVAKIMGTTPTKMKTMERGRRTSDARKITSAILHGMGYSRQEIGKSLGYSMRCADRCLRDHTELMRFNPKYRELYQKIWGEVRFGNEINPI